MTAEQILWEKHALRSTSADRGTHAFSPQPDEMTQFSGLGALGALAVTQPLRLVDAEMYDRRVNADHSGVEDGHLRHLASRAWEERVRLVLFAVNGLLVFAVGLLIQVILVRYAGMGSVLSYIVQTIVSVQLGFLLSRLTWRDRDVAMLPALARFNLQQLVVTGLGIGGYAGLEHLGVDYIVANVAVTAVLTPVSFLSSHKWSLVSPQRKLQRSPSLQREEAGALRRNRRRHRLLVGCAVAVAVLVMGLALGIRVASAESGGARVVVGWPGIQYVVYVVWLVPLAELSMLTAGQLFYRLRFRTAPAGTFTHLIIQITTTGREEQRVNEVIGQIQAMGWR